MAQNAQLRNFCNDKARQTFDQLDQAYETARRFASEYSAYGVAALLGDLQNTDVIIDGSETDGRKSLTVKELKDLKTVADALVSWADTQLIGAKNYANRVKAGSVNGQPPF